MSTDPNIDLHSDLLPILESPRVSAPTRAALRERLAPIATDNTAYVPKLLSPSAMETLRALIARLLPDATGLEIAERLETQVATGPGDGWRYDSLPTDSTAMAQGLRHLDTAASSHFANLSPSDQDDLLQRVQAGAVTWPGLDAARWFEEILAAATALYVSHPSVMLAMGFDGFADEPGGWSEIGFGNTQSWEPAPHTPTREEIR